MAATGGKRAREENKDAKIEGESAAKKAKYAVWDVAFTELALQDPRHQGDHAQAARVPFCLEIMMPPIQQCENGCDDLCCCIGCSPGPGILSAISSAPRAARK